MLMQTTDPTIQMQLLGLQVGIPLELVDRLGESGRDNLEAYVSGSADNTIASERLYVPVDKSTTIICSPNGARCRVSGTVQFECRSYMRGAYSAGLASYTLTVDVAGAHASVIEESGRVLQRR